MLTSQRMITGDDMINFIKKLFKNEIFRYLFFGGLTTIVSLGSYGGIMYAITGGAEPNQLQVQSVNVISWVFAVAFAYITNKLYVFNSRTTGVNQIMKEITAFVSARVFSLVVEMAWMLVSIEFLSMNNYLAKFVGQFIVVVMNYFFSKLFIFKKNKDGGI